MSITLIKEGGQYRVISATGTVPEGVPVVFYTKEETIDPWDRAALDSFFSDGEDWGDSIDAMVVNDDQEARP